MSNPAVIVEREDHIGIITLNRPEHFNTFNTSLAKDFNQALVQLDQEENVRVVIVKGAGKAFSVGIDLSEYEGKTRREYYTWVSLMEQMNQVIAHMKKPVIACAHGFAVANGAGLIAACDLAVVAEGTKIGVSAINVGLFCMGPAVPLSRSLGRKRCLEMLLTGDLVDARDAERWGLVNKVVPEDRLLAAAMEMAKKLAAKSPVALQMGKKAFYGMSDMAFGKALEYSNEVFAGLCVLSLIHI